MKKLLLSCFAAVLLLFGGMTSIHADEYLRVGMEAAYAPFNWTQDDDSNGAVSLKELINMLTDMMSKLLRKLQTV